MTTYLLIKWQKGGETVKWTKELISQKILEAKCGLEIDCMPTRSQMDKYYGDTCLSNRVGKTLGFYGWAEYLGLKIQDNDTRKGKLAEQWAAEYLIDKGFKPVQMSQNYPFDLLVNGCVKIDVKFSNLYRSKDRFGFYSFALRKPYPTCDAYMLIAQKESGDRTVYIVPSACAVQQQISIGEHKSVYEKYIDNIAFLSKLAGTLLEVS